MKQLIFCLIFSAILLASGMVQASPLRLEYTVSPIAGDLYDYEFKLSVDNNDGTYSSGQTWGWISFGETLSDTDTSPFSDFTPDTSDYPIGQYTSITTGTNSILTNSAPYLSPLQPTWLPTGIGDSFSWSGTSASYLGTGRLLFTTYSTGGGAVAAVDQVAIHLIPEPGTFLLLGMGLMGLARQTRRKN